MGEYAAKALVGVVGCGAIGVACYMTQSGQPLWGVLLVAILVSNMSNRT